MSESERDEQIAGSIGEPEAAEQAGTPEAQEPGPLEQAILDRDAAHERWLRAQAELENFRKRMHREQEEERKYREINLVRDLLPGLDNLRRAVEAATASGQGGELVEGVQLVLRQFEEVLAAHKAVAIEAAGLPFDPNCHEALQQIPTSEHPPLTVLQEVQKGYTLHDRVVRPAQVIVSAAVPEPASGEDAG